MYSWCLYHMSDTLSVLHHIVQNFVFVALTKEVEITIGCMCNSEIQVYNKPLLLVVTETAFM